MPPNRRGPRWFMSIGRPDDSRLTCSPVLKGIKDPGKAAIVIFVRHHRVQLRQADRRTSSRHRSRGTTARSPPDLSVSQSDRRRDKRYRSDRSLSFLFSLSHRLLRSEIGLIDDVHRLNLSGFDRLRPAFRTVGSSGPVTSWSRVNSRELALVSLFFRECSGPVDGIV